MSKSSNSEPVFTPKHWVFLGLVVLATGVFAWTVQRGEPGELPSPSEAPPPIPAALRQMRPASNQLVILGLDGADWSQLLPLLDGGRLPTLARLMQHGSYGHLRTLLPTVSPMIWTSVATGKRPEKHGITDFQVWDEEEERLVLATGRKRKTQALWNLLSYYNTPVGVVNWWTTWPAERVEGFVLSDLAALGRRKQLEEKADLRQESGEGAIAAGAYYPLALQTIERGIPAGKVGVSDLSRFAELPEVDQAELEALESFETGNPLSVLKFSYLGDRYYSEMTLGALSEFGPPDLLLYYTSSTDALAHTLWKFSHPGEGYPVVESELEGRYGRTLERYYEWVDSQLGRILSHYPGDVNVVLLSDHGMIGMPDVTGGVKNIISARHTDHALVIVSGKDFQQGEVFATRRIEGENFERWKGSINYQERGYRNLFPGGWMESAVVTREGSLELSVDFEQEGESSGGVDVSWDGVNVGELSEEGKLRIESTRGLHRLRLTYRPNGEEAAMPLHPRTVPWTAFEVSRDEPAPFQPRKDWGYALYGDEGLWVLTWSAYEGRLFERHPTFSGTLRCEQGIQLRSAAPPKEGEGLELAVEENAIRFRDALSGRDFGHLEFIPSGPAELDLEIDGDRYPRMVYLRPFSRLKVDAVVLKPVDGESSSPDASVLDIVPTALALFGLPVAEDMDGRVWSEHLRPEVLERQSGVKVASYEGLPREIPAGARQADEEALQDRLAYLETLGYIRR